ncbi:MAG: chlorite dismutase family protein [Candidatus Latescibacteria bacterium]|nr:chlorite dismutase family protein [Candidatus Latescibacterota bacterium]
MSSHERSGRGRGTEPAEPARRQYVNFAFYKADSAWRRLPASEQDEGKREFAGVVEQFLPQMIVLPYSTVGLRADTDFMLWRIGYEIESFQEMTAQLLRTGLGKYLDTPYSLLSMTKRSIYVDRHHHEGQEGTRLHIIPGEAKYLFVYPFVKTRDWYRLSKATRQGMMNEHIEVGHRYASVKLNTTYSFGLDDQEFVVAFETDKPDDFLDLVMELRETEGSRYTLRDTPIFTCVRRDLRAILDQVG